MSDMASDPHWQKQRVRAIEAIGNLGVEEHAEHLLGLATDPEPDISRAAVRSVAKLKGAGATIQRLVEQLAPDDDEEIRSTVRTLAFLGEDTAAEILEEIARSGDRDRELSAVALLRNLEGDRAREALGRLEKDVPATEREESAARQPATGQEDRPTRDPRVWFGLDLPLDGEEIWGTHRIGSRSFGGSTRGQIRKFAEGDSVVHATKSEGASALLRVREVLREDRDVDALLEGVADWPSPVGLEAVRSALPGLAAVRADPPPAISAMNERTWRTLRELILVRNPDAESDLPESGASPVHASRVDRIQTREGLLTGEPIIAKIRVLNTGTDRWPADDIVSVRWNYPDAEAGRFDDPLGREIAPGDAWEHELHLGAAGDPGIYGVEISAQVGDLPGFRAVPGKQRFEVREAAPETRDDPAPGTRDEPTPGTGEDPEPAGDEGTGSGPGEATPDTTVPEIEIAEAGAAQEDLLAGSTAIRAFAVRTLAPPRDGRTLTLEVGTGSPVHLVFAGDDYYSPNRVDPDRLRALRARSPEAYGEALFGMVISDDEAGAGDRTSLRGLARALADGTEGFGVEILVPPGDTEYRGIRWECLRDPTSDEHLALRGSVPLVRRVAATPLTPVDPPFKVLVAVCSPSTLGTDANRHLASLAPLNLVRERLIAENALADLASRGLAEFAVLTRDRDDPVTPKRIKVELNKGYHVLHLVAHGFDDGHEYRIVLEDEDGGHALRSPEEFAAGLPEGKLRLVILGVCDSAAIEGRSPAEAFGPKLVTQGVPAVVSMQDQLGFDTAQLFTQHFYDALARTGRIDVALASTRHSIATLEGADSWAWTIPVLESGSGETRLFEPQERARDLPPLRPRILTPAELEEEARRDEPVDLEDRIESVVQDPAIPAEQRARRIREEVVAHQEAGREEGRLAAPQEHKLLQMALRKPVALTVAELRNRATARGFRFDDRVYRQVASALNAGKHVILTGPPGTGKTSLAHIICATAFEHSFSLGTIPSTASADWTTFDTVGGYVPTASQTLAFRPGIMLRAIQSMCWLALDEINRAEIDKAIGEIFTVLAGQMVELPYQVDGKQLRVHPPRKSELNRWLPDRDLTGYDYVVHPNWRIVGTMNVYDKSSLFSMSFAFMRRFAFVEVPVPGPTVFERLFDDWTAGYPREVATELKTRLHEIFTAESTLKRHRELGPAIARDMLRFYARLGTVDPAAALSTRVALGEAFLLYVMPQLDGLHREAVLVIHRELLSTFGEEGIGTQISRSLRSLYPHIPEREWGASQEQADEPVEDDRER